MGTEMERTMTMARTPDQIGPPAFILASTSTSRQRMLAAAGVAFEAVSPHVDEDEIKTSLKASGSSARSIADALAETKAVKVSRRKPGSLVLGADQILALGNDEMLDKPKTLSEARSHLERLSGRDHQLVSAAVIALDGAPIWRAIDTATLRVRSLTPEFMDTYLEAEGEALLSTVGCYRLEGRGAQLFSQVSGDHFTVLGLPLLPVLGYLRDRGILKQ